MSKCWTKKVLGIWLLNAQTLFEEYSPVINKLGMLFNWAQIANKEQFEKIREDLSLMSDAEKKEEVLKIKNWLKKAFNMKWWEDYTWSLWSIQPIIDMLWIVKDYEGLSTDEVFEYNIEKNGKLVKEKLSSRTMFTKSISSAVSKLSVWTIDPFIDALHTKHPLAFVWSFLDPEIFKQLVRSTNTDWTSLLNTERPIDNATAYYILMRTWALKVLRNSPWIQPVSYEEVNALTRWLNKILKIPRILASPLAYLNSLSVTLPWIWKININTSLKTIWQFALWWAMMSLVLSWFISTAVRWNTIRKTIEKQDIDLRDITFDDLRDIWIIWTFISDNTMLQKIEQIFQQFTGKDITIADSFVSWVWMLMWAWEQVKSTFVSWIQNIPVDVWHYPTYITTALLLTSKEYWINDKDVLISMMKDKVFKAEFFGRFNRHMQSLQWSHTSEQSRWKELMPVMYHMMKFFSNWWGNIFKHMIYAPFRLVMRWLEGNLTKEDLHKWLVNNLEFRLFIANILQASLMMYKLERIWEDEEDDELLPEHEKIKKFWLSYIRNFVPYLWSLQAAWWLRMFSVPWTFLYEQSKITDLEWNRIPISMHDIFDSVFAQFLQEFRWSNKLLTFTSTITDKILYWSFNEEDWRTAMVELYNQMVDWYWLALTWEIRRQLDNWTYVPQSMSQQYAIRSALWLSANDMSDLNFRLSKINQLQSLIKYNEEDWEQSIDIWRTAESIAWKVWVWWLFRWIFSALEYLTNKNIINNQEFSNREIRVAMDTLRENWTDRYKWTVDFRKLDSDTNKYVLFSVLSSVFDTRNWNFNSYTAPFYEKDWEVINARKFDLYNEVFDLQIKEQYPKHYDAIKDLILNTKWFQAKNEAIDKYMDLLDDISPKTRLAIRLKAELDTRLAQAWWDKYIQREDIKEVKWVLKQNPVSPETRDSIIASVLNDYQKSIKAVDEIAYHRSFIYSNRFNESVWPLLNKNQDWFDYKKIWNQSVPAWQMSIVQFLQWTRVAEWWDPVRINNAYASLLYNMQKSLETKWMDAWTAQAVTLKNYMEMLDWYNLTEWDKLDMTVPTMLAHKDWIRSVYNNPKLKEVIWEDWVNYLKTMIHWTFDSLKSLWNESNWLNTTVEDLRDFNGKLFWTNNNARWSSTYGSYPKNTYNRIYPNIKPFFNFYKPYQQQYFKDSRINFYTPKTQLFNTQWFNTYKANNQYVQKNPYFRLDKQWGNAVSAITWRWKGFTLSAKRTKSYPIIKSKGKNTRARSNNKTTNTRRA